MLCETVHGNLYGARLLEILDTLYQQFLINSTGMVEVKVLVECHLDLLWRQGPVKGILTYNGDPRYVRQQTNHFLCN